MKNILLLSKNYSKYRSGYYHNDIVEAVQEKSNCYIYGPGYEDYDVNDDITQVIAKSGLPSIDAIICSTSWDDDTSKSNVDPHPNINLSNIKDIFKIYFLNKEYKKLNKRLEYAKENKFDLILTVHPDYAEWSRLTGLKVKQFHFGINLNRFRNLNRIRKIDFTFSGGLHKTHTDARYLVKQKIFRSEYLEKKSNTGMSNLFRKNYLQDDIAMYNICWMEWGAKNYFWKNLLPSGEKYVDLMNNTKVILNTPSAIGIFNTRFLEAMACGAVIMCPDNGNYSGIMNDGINCIMYKSDLSDFVPKLKLALSDQSQLQVISANALACVEEHSYALKIQNLLSEI